MDNKWIGLVIALLLALLLIVSADALNRMGRIENGVETIAVAFDGDTPTATYRVPTLMPILTSTPTYRMPTLMPIFTSTPTSPVAIDTPVRATAETPPVVIDTPVQATAVTEPPPVINTPVRTTALPAGASAEANDPPTAQATVFLTVTPPFPTPTVDTMSTAMLTTNTILRATAGLSGTMITVLPSGTVVEIDVDSAVSRNGYTWYRVETATLSGWIADLGLQFSSRE